MRRGFKTEARELAGEIRVELGISPVEPLDPWQLASHLEIPVWTLSSYASIAPLAAAHLLERDTRAFSALLVSIGLRCAIVHNDAHVPVRQRADICHELAHALLLHRPHSSNDGRPPKFDQEQEEEATWLGGVLLVTDEFCVACAIRSVDIAEAAAFMGVSTQLMRWRWNMSGARRRIARAGRIAP
jgi:hypothetical protein